MEYFKATYTVDEQVEVHDAIAYLFVGVGPDGYGAKTNKHYMDIKHKMKCEEPKTFSLSEKQRSTIKWALKKYRARNSAGE